MGRSIQLAAALAALAAAACTDRNQAPAEAAMKEAETAIAQLGGDVARLAPDQARAAEGAWAAARASLAARDYGSALAQASAVPPRARAAVAAAAARRDALAQAWEAASRDVENLVYAVEDRLETLSEAKRLPGGLDAAAVSWAKETLLATRASCSQARERFQRGDAEGAIAQAQEARAQAGEVLRRVGIR